MLTAGISDVLRPEWSRLEPVHVGCITPGQNEPDCYVVVFANNDPFFRVDVHAYRPDCFAFQDAIVWLEQLFIGYGSHVHAVSLRDRSSVTFALGSYFGHAYTTTEYLLIASGERVFRINPDRSLAWNSPVVAVDGVIVTSAEPPTIQGMGDWDPPDGWKGFSLSPHDGQLV